MKYIIALASVLMVCTSIAHGQEKITVEKFAEYPGGAEKFFEFIRKEVRYPSDALRDSIAGDVHVTFIVSASGQILPESIKIAKGLSTSCDAEALRVIRKAPAWISGKGKEAGASKSSDIEQQITFPVSFRLE